MFIGIIVALLALAILSLLGLAVVLLLPPAVRAQVLPAAPILGIALAVCYLHLHSLVAGTAVAPWVLPILAVVLAVLGARVHRSVSLGGRSGIGRAVTGVLASAVAIPVALIPMIGTGSSRSLLMGLSNDGYYYISTARWFSENATTIVPSIEQDPVAGVSAPNAGPASETLFFSLRYGQELVQGWLSGLTGIDLTDAFTAWTALYIALIALAAFSLAQILRLPPVAGVIAALAVATSNNVLHQFVAQNADSLLGGSFAILSIGLVWRALETSEHRAPFVALAGFALAGLAGTYSEYFSFVVVVLGLVTLLRPVRAVPGALLGAVVIALASLVLNPVGWVRTVSNVLNIAAVAAPPTEQGEDYIVDTVFGTLASAGEFVGLHGFAPTGRLSTLLSSATVWGVGVVVVLGLLVAAVHRSTARVGRAVLIASVLLASYGALRGSSYFFQRMIDVVSPFVVAVSALGVVLLLVPLVRRGGAARTVGAVALGGLSLGWVAVNGVAYGQQLIPTWGEREISPDYREAGDWVEALDDGADVTVMTGDLFQQMWISDELQDEPDVAYPSLRGDLGYRGDLSMSSFWNARATRYLLVGTGARYAASESAVLERNGTFVLLDLSAGSAAAAVNTSPGPAWSYFVDPSERLYGGAGARIAVVGNTDVELGLAVVNLPGVAEAGVDVDFDGDGCSAAGDAAQVTAAEVSAASGVCIVETLDPASAPGPDVRVALDELTLIGG
ncbi:hypothetical protein NB037_04975 [Rathayibacter sp. ZW T2_19]|uniref:Uncharacterized protein n=1 Tax=Rathayibacter rubneri TaxID=2950106 RepID=A0A9X2DVZ3_9MICO|nr:hypothetical protein [Rathayibacter rubneri]MCM6761767.1 hypothetical protein [Rathayibacter rubneri]